MRGFALAVLFAFAGNAFPNDALPNPLTGAKGDPAKGRALVANRQVGLCLLCHSGPFPEERFQGDLAPVAAVVTSVTRAAASMAVSTIAVRIIRRQLVE